MQQQVITQYCAPWSGYFNSSQLLDNLLDTGETTGTNYRHSGGLLAEINCALCRSDVRDSIPSAPSSCKGSPMRNGDLKEPLLRRASSQNREGDDSDVPQAYQPPKGPADSRHASYLLYLTPATKYSLSLSGGVQFTVVSRQLHFRNIYSML